MLEKSPEPPTCQPPLSALASSGARLRADRRGHLGGAAPGEGFLRISGAAPAKACSRTLDFAFADAACAAVAQRLGKSREAGFEGKSSKRTDVACCRMLSDPVPGQRLEDEEPTGKAEPRNI